MRWDGIEIREIGERDWGMSGRAARRGKIAVAWLAMVASSGCGGMRLKLERLGEGIRE